jgi:4-hydroxy-3-methylbut-2-en-1-yl diphosphate reductase
MIVDIEPHSGFCSGVKRVVKLAETELSEGKQLQCLGEIVHNHSEVERLTNSGMSTIQSSESGSLENQDILIRAHGEPTSTYELLKKGNNRIIDGTCPVVLRVQNKVREAYVLARTENGKVVIHGKGTHPEVIGLLGQIANDGLAATQLEELNMLDFSKPVYLFSQTTMPLESFKDMEVYIRQKMGKFFKPGEEPLHVYDTICRQVANRVPQLSEFAKSYDVIVFVGGANSSNGKVLFQTCKNRNDRSYFVSEKGTVQKEWFVGANSAGICGATSTPLWQMEEIKNEIIELLNKK